MPKIQWDFFPVEYRTFSVDSFLCLSLRERLITGEQNIDPQSMDLSTVFDELFNLKTKKILNLQERNRLILFFEGCTAQNELRVNVTNKQLFSIVSFIIINLI